MSVHSTPLVFAIGKDGAPNALFDQLNRVVCSFPTDRAHDTRRGSPSTPETILANAQLFAAAPDLLDALKGAYAGLNFQKLVREATGDVDGAHYNLLCQQCEQARAAIAKAQGGAK